jgi:hypothetical protein
MRIYIRSLFVLVVACGLQADSRNPADYPLRIHVFRRAETTFYHQRVAEETKGEGRANLFENGEPRGLDFEFDCGKKLKTSSGFETFPAKWRKPQEELIVLQPEFGKAGSYSTCRFKVQMKDFAYYTHNGALSSEPIATFKDWMTKHQYDPEHGKDEPTPTHEPAQVTPPAKPPENN